MDMLPEFDTDLLRRYDRPGPRYTSYPTAPQFGSGFGERQLRSAIAASNGDPLARPISLYVHVPYCLSPCFYCGCNRVITRDRQRGDRYVERLLREIALMAPLFDRDREVVQLHFGGGTPNFLPPEQLGRIVDALQQQFDFGQNSDSDLSIELDPRTLQPGDVSRLAALGLNRASLGVQDFDPEVQRAVNREQSVEQTLAVIDECRSAGFRSVNVDLIYGLPKQSIEGFGRTLQTVLAARPDRLAIYGYAHLPAKFKAQRQIHAVDLPDAPTRIALLSLAIEKLRDAGYCHIGMDHFALPEDDLAVAQARRSLQRNFMGYTTHADSDLVGFGVSAISHIDHSFSQNPRDLLGWELALDAGRLPVWRGLQLSRDDRVRADIIQQLMCHGEADIDTVERRYDLEFTSYFDAELTRLQALVADGLVVCDSRSIRATPRGRLLMRNIAMCFDRYLQQPSPVVPSALTSAVEYSRSI